LRMGDRTFEVMHAPGHSSDSICLYCEQEGVVFSGDAPMGTRYADGAYDRHFVEVLERLARGHITSIYFGHGDPELGGGKALLCSSVKNIRGMGEK